MTAAQKKSAIRWTALLAPSIALMGFLVTQGFCVAPWQQMSKAEAAQQHAALRSLVVTQHDRLGDKLEQINKDVSTVIGTLTVIRENQLACH